MERLKFTGGARIGMANATWPFATLTVTKDRLDLNTSVFGNLAFTREDVITMKYWSGFMSRGIQIHHKVPGYKQKVIFWTFGNPKRILAQIEDIGFFGTTPETQDQEIKNQVIEKQKRRGFPMRISYLIALILLWNLFFVVDFMNGSDGARGDFIPIGSGALFALGLLFITSILTLTSKAYRLIALKNGRGVEDIKSLMIFLLIITGINLLTFLFFYIL